MKEILIFAGTTEGRELSECLSDSGIAHRICVATEYGEIVLKEHPLAKVHCGRMNQEEIRKYIEKGDFLAIVDATHPYADVVTENIKQAMKDIKIPYIRLKRELDREENAENVFWFDKSEACAKALEEIEGNILLTTGSKELANFCILEEVRNRLYVRILPGLESLELCIKQGIVGKQILALQGPFSVEMNEAMLRQYQIKCLVTKASGRNGGYQEKLKAAKKVGIPVFVIGHLGADEGDSFSEVCHKLEVICGQTIKVNNRLEIILAGVGMGNNSTMTKEVRQAIENADILLGAERMLAAYRPKYVASKEAKLQHANLKNGNSNIHKAKLEKPFYKAEQIIPYLKELQKTAHGQGKIRVVILFSGDSGFYSGCQTLYRALQKEIEKGGIEASLRIMPGISSVAYLAACIGESYQNAALYSIHGKSLPNLVGKIKREEKLFLLMSGVKDINKLGRLLTDVGMHDCEIIAGYQMSYPTQKIKRLTPRECCEEKEEGLYTCFIKNPYPQAGKLTHGTKDDEFIRDKVPMTKEEVREVSICKLKLHRGAVVYDIGSGTGSIAVEVAGLSDDIQVFAVEQKEEAVSLINKNKEKFCLENITIISGKAPKVLKDLQVPTHAFIGGSGGKMKEILSVLYDKNPNMRVVINAISMETICEIKEILSLYPIENEEIVQLQVSRAKKAGSYHLMQAENPVWICAFSFCEPPKWQNEGKDEA